MNDLVRKRDIDYISAPIAPVLKGEKVHYEYVAFRKQIEDISPVPAIPIPEGATNGDMIKALFPTEYGTLNFDIHRGSWWNSPYRQGETDE